LVARVIAAAVLRFDQPDAPAEAARNRRGVVGRAVIDDDDFRCRPRLCQRAFDGCVQPAGGVEARDADGDERRRHGVRAIPADQTS
jgi:hypothetical protein